MQKTDVLIVGAGPTGITLAVELAAKDIDFRIVDSRTEISDKSRALALQPRSLELFNRYGDIAGLIARGRQPSGITTWVNGKRVLDLEFGTSDELSRDYGTNFPLPLLVSQSETERFLNEHLQEISNTLPERGTTAQLITQDDTGVTVTLENGTECEELRCKYVIGADGANSTVRQAGTQFKFSGTEYPQEFLLCDCRVQWKDAQKGKAMAMLGAGSLIVIPLHEDFIRLAGSNWMDEEREPTLQDFQDYLDKMAPGQGVLSDAVWLSRFRLSNRGVNTYRDGRLFLAGDAAHVHSPAGGQGMNTGIQDSINLGWKLAEVLKQKRPDSFLDSYDEERSPVGKKVLGRTDRIFAVATAQNPVAVFLRNFLAQRIQPFIFNKDSERWKFPYRFSSQLAIRYRRSSLVGTSSGFTGPVRGGDRAPDGKLMGPEGETQFHNLFRSLDYQLILFSGVGTKAASDEELLAAVAGCGLDTRTRIVRDQGPGYCDADGALHKMYGFSEPGYVYVRPDIYVEHIGLLNKVGEFKASLGNRATSVEMVNEKA